MTCTSAPQAASPLQVLWPLMARFIKNPLLMLALSAGLLLGTLSSSRQPATASPVPQLPTLEDGTYVFGDAPQAGQTGATYIVLEVSDRQVLGAFYQPSSSFDCFYGQVGDNRLLLTVVSSYDQVQYPYALALEATDAQVAGPTAAQLVVPSGFHALSPLSELDTEILATCQAVQPL